MSRANELQISLEYEDALWRLCFACECAHENTVLKSFSSPWVHFSILGEKAWGRGYFDVERHC